ncbi:hypothetical protein ACI762_06340 [Capnocytophaga canimorsus]|uniref:hypothetical protein n=1 Tax=Capnocytophaga canimorsus TaxID=28188 RepID=UPI003859300C
MFLILFLLFSAIVYLINQSKKIDEGFVASDEQKEPYYDFPCCVTKDYVRRVVPNEDTSGGPTDMPDVPDAGSGGSDSGSSGGTSQGSGDTETAPPAPPRPIDNENLLPCIDASLVDFVNFNTPSFVYYPYDNAVCNSNRRKVKIINSYDGFKLPNDLNHYNTELATLMRSEVKSMRYTHFPASGSNNELKQKVLDYTSEPPIILSMNNGLSLRFKFDFNAFSENPSYHTLEVEEIDFIRKGKSVYVLESSPYDKQSGADVFDFHLVKGSYEKDLYKGGLRCLIVFADEQEAIKFVEIMSNFIKEASEYETSSSSDEGYSGHTEDPQGYATMGM